MLRKGQRINEANIASHPCFIFLSREQRSKGQAGYSVVV